MSRGVLRDSKSAAAAIALSNWLGAAVGAEIKKHGSDAATPKNKGLVK